MCRLASNNAYVIDYEGFTCVDGDVERVIFIRQVSPPLYAVSVPQFKTEKRERILLEAYFIDEHLLRCGHPRQVADSNVADQSNPLAVAFHIVVEVEVEPPTFGACERFLRARIA